MISGRCRQRSSARSHARMHKKEVEAEGSLHMWEMRSVASIDLARFVVAAAAAAAAATVDLEAIKLSRQIICGSLDGSFARLLF